jgi:pimeloyl-ACP methyl ester carboxylesterase
VHFTSGSETLYGFWLRQPGGAPRLTVLFSHGRGKNLAGDVEWGHAEFLWRSGFDVLIYDYRGFGRSTGDSKDETTLAEDVRAALAFALTQPEVTLARVISYGHSLGSSPAIAIAAATPGLRALVIEAGFANGQAMAESANPLGIPVGWILKEPMLNTTHIATVRSPVLILHGEDDRKIPVAQGRDLWAAAKDPKQLVVVTGAGHESVQTVMGLQALGGLLRSFTNASAP